MFKKKILIVNYFLGIGGAEKYVFELTKFLVSHNIRPIIVIPNRKDQEFYDRLFEEQKVKVLRVDVCSFKILLKNFDFRSIYWNILFRFLGNVFFTKVHFMNLVIADRYMPFFNISRKVLWHITNKIQYEGRRYTFRPEIFEDNSNLLVYINKYQENEIHESYNVKCREVHFKLILNDD
ncbi:hypothetical protein [Sphingobacterium bovistauri]|uniref:Glycosyltransferase subfamily 4-like N-terminal domain-containing protein n=1 Tax=Sphingobacterium bovistauri TaxID=2781959 RepID=A0ABS7Z1V6_9SPHI|nr:hypothetical protein [Sphingobacterium bovistauri]MCA5004111.1 hypothetical protein [Sphingobacterium bovistauri]